MALMDPETNKKVVIKKGAGAIVRLFPDKNYFTISFTKKDNSCVLLRFDNGDDKMIFKGDRINASSILDLLGDVIGVSWKFYQKPSSPNIMYFKAI